MRNFQDINAFSDDNFDTKAWINEILKSSEAQEKKEVRKHENDLKATLNNETLCLGLYHVFSNEDAVVRSTSKYIFRRGKSTGIHVFTEDHKGYTKSPRGRNVAARENGVG